MLKEMEFLIIEQVQEFYQVHEWLDLDMVLQDMLLQDMVLLHMVLQDIDIKL
jgi:hypothetical protein